jgi:hypothetical protein
MIGKLARTGSRLAADERFTGNFSGRHTPGFGQLVLRAADHHQHILAAHFRLHPGQMRRRFDQAEIQHMFGHARFDGFGVGNCHVHLHMGMHRFKLAEDLRQVELGDGSAGTQQQRPADRTGKLTDAGFQFLGQGQDSFSVSPHQLPGGSQRNAAMAALEQPCIEMFLQLLDLESHRRLGHEQLLRRLRERKLAGNGMEYLQATIGHGKSGDVWRKWGYYPFMPCRQSRAAESRENPGLRNSNIPMELWYKTAVPVTVG